MSVRAPAPPAVQMSSALNEAVKFRHDPAFLRYRDVRARGLALHQTAEARVQVREEQERACKFVLDNDPKAKVYNPADDADQLLRIRAQNDIDVPEYRALSTIPKFDADAHREAYVEAVQAGAWDGIWRAWTTWVRAVGDYENAQRRRSELGARLGLRQADIYRKPLAPGDFMHVNFVSRMPSWDIEFANAIHRMPPPAAAPAKGGR